MYVYIYKGSGFLKRWYLSVRELDMAVGSELRAHSEPRRMAVLKILRIMSNKTKVLETVRIRILSLDFLFVTSRRMSGKVLSGNICFGGGKYQSISGHLSIRPEIN